MNDNAPWFAPVLLATSIALVCSGLAPTLPSAHADSPSFRGKVTAVLTGATLIVTRGNKQQNIRLFGISCPTRWHVLSDEAKQFTSGRALGKMVTVDEWTVDRDGTSVATIF